MWISQNVPTQSNQSGSAHVAYSVLFNCWEKQKLRNIQRCLLRKNKKHTVSRFLFQQEMLYSSTRASHLLLWNAQACALENCSMLWLQQMFQAKEKEATFSPPEHIVSSPALLCLKLFRESFNSLFLLKIIYFTVASSRKMLSTRSLAYILIQSEK